MNDFKVDPDKDNKCSYIDCTETVVAYTFDGCFYEEHFVNYICAQSEVSNA